MNIISGFNMGRLQEGGEGRHIAPHHQSTGVSDLPSPSNSAEQWSAAINPLSRLVMRFSYVIEQRYPT